MKTILSLCDFTGNWSRPYADHGYDVIRIDLQNGQDVRMLEFIDQPIHGILAAPPCDHFALSGARWWAGKGDQALLDGLAVVDACLRAVAIYRPIWWVLENPVGRLSRFLGPRKWSFDPCDFGDPYTKRTNLWGHFTPPVPLFAATARLACEPIESSKMHTAVRNKARRSVTPMGFAQAFFEVNP